MHWQIGMRVRRTVGSADIGIIRDLYQGLSTVYGEHERAVVEFTRADRAYTLDVPTAVLAVVEEPEVAL